MITTRVGQVRPSQLLYTYGPGSLVDLPHISVLVTGLDVWSLDPLNSTEIVERRLLAAVQRQPNLHQVGALRLPPHLPETRDALADWARTGVPVTTFPVWIRCPACDRIAPCDSKLFKLEERVYRPDLTRYVHANCSKTKGKAPPAVPVRFLLACRNGHLDEFPWLWFVHKGPPCATPILEMFEREMSSRADDVFVVCRNCDARRSMVDAFGLAGQKNLPGCRGRHPHLQSFDPKPCDAPNRALLLGASNSWFSVTLRVLAIPPAATPLGQLIDTLWPVVEKVKSAAILEYAIEEGNPALKELKGFPVEEVWAEIEARRHGTEDEKEPDSDLLTPEWQQLSNPSGAINGPDFQLREVKAPPSFTPVVERVVLGERLREVVALVGYTRIDPPGEVDAKGRYPVTGPLARNAPTWVPCTEVRGEGIFLQFAESAMQAWETKIDQDERMAAILGSHQRWRARRKLEPHGGFPGSRYLLLHTISHLLMREFALECGYGSASLTERIYAHSGTNPMAGILLYTAAPDSEGTLGGLVSLGEPDTLDRMLRQALRHAEVCSSDPMCAEHIPGEEEDVLHGAACHSCVFAPETSCERSNRYLDRALVVDTLATAGIGFFAGAG